jgi:pimeloyl-ACP methyl ester carboxylesterase
LEIAGFLRGGVFRGTIPKDRAQDGLFMLHPYRKGRMPVVLVHGTASSPARWAELINELEGDPRIRERFQIWVFFYDSGNPIPYSAGRLRGALTATLRELDPKDTDPALHRMVVIGHSQGGLLTKLTTIDNGTRFWDRVSDKPIDQIQVDPETRTLLQRSLFFTPLPFVERVVFMATPHRGALLATGRIGAIATWLVTLPGDLFTRATQLATLTGDEKLVRFLRRPPTAIDNMNPDNPGIQMLASIPVDRRIKAHSIIGVQGDGPKEEGDDRVVAYRSAHIDEAVSERVINSDHGVQQTPEGIEEVRRILLEHAGVADGHQP